VKGILAAGTETTQIARPTGDAGAPAHLHGPDQLFAVPVPVPVPVPDVLADDVLADDVLADDVLADDVLADDVLADVVALPTAHGADATAPATATPAPSTATGLTSSEGVS
jgi:hypothetical protein